MSYETNDNFNLKNFCVMQSLMENCSKKDRCLMNNSYVQQSTDLAAYSIQYSRIITIIIIQYFIENNSLKVPKK